MGWAGVEKSPPRETQCGCTCADQAGWVVRAQARCLCSNCGLRNGQFPGRCFNERHAHSPFCQDCSVYCEKAIREQARRNIIDSKGSKAKGTGKKAGRGQGAGKALRHGLQCILITSIRFAALYSSTFQCPQTAFQYLQSVVLNLFGLSICGIGTFLKLMTTPCQYSNLCRVGKVSSVVYHSQLNLT